jgi:hypothetical protein
MATQDTCCSIAPYFKVAEGKLAEFKALGDEFVTQTNKEGGCLYYGFSFDGDIAHCREGYENCDALLAHLDNVGELLGKALEMSELIRLEIHGPEQELPKIREAMAEMPAQFFVLECGFRR